MNPQHVNEKAINMLINAADGIGESKGVIDEYRYRAGDTQMADYEELAPQQEFQSALNLLIKKGWAKRLPPPAHHQALKEQFSLPWDSRSHESATPTTRPQWIGQTRLAPSTE